MSDWLYQVRIRVSERLSESLRSGRHTDLANNLDSISNDHGMSLVCTYDAFKGYCDEAEENGIEEYALYDWTKATIENPEKKAISSSSLNSIGISFNPSSIFQSNVDSGRAT